MRCEVLAIGTELLLGQIVDTNSAWIGEQLAEAGIDSYLHVQVGDNQARVVEQLRGLLAEAIREMFMSRGRAMPASNLRQADVPKGGEAIPNPNGTAPGLLCPVGSKVAYAVPGVPHEMQHMVAAAV